MIIALVLLAVLAGILGLAATRPATIEIRRTVDIKAPPERIFALIDDFHHWPAWAPQDRMDPTMRRTYGGPSSGAGAWSEWLSKGQAGCGRMEVTGSTAPLGVTVRVDFAKPFKACNIHEFRLEAGNGGSRLNWSMRGTNPLVARLMGLFFNMEKMMGKHFESGLQALKALCERQGADPAG